MKYTLVRLSICTVLPCFICCTAFAQQSVNLNWLKLSPKDATGVSWGVPWKRGEAKRNSSFELVRSGGSAIPVQSWDLAYWPDGSVKWSGLATVADSNSKDLQLRLVSDKSKAPVKTSLQLTSDKDSIYINTGVLKCVLPRKGNSFMTSLKLAEKLVAENGQLECILQNMPDADLENSPTRQILTSTIEQTTIEQMGPIRAVVRINGRFINSSTGKTFLPFIIRLYFYSGVQDIRMVYTMIYDGDAKKDFIKGIGFNFSVPFREKIHNRHVRLGGEEDGIWAEPVQPLNGRRSNPYIADQAIGKLIPDADTSRTLQNFYRHLASWSDYKLVQHSVNGFIIQKRTNDASSWLYAVGGKRSSGIAFAGDAKGGLALSLKNFWQSYPAALEVNGMKGNAAKMNLWIWSPYADAMDLRHYDTAGHDLEISYEDYDEGFSTPHGIARTSEIMIYPHNAIPSNQELADQANETNNIPLLVPSPQYLHGAGVFGAWSLPDRSTKGKQWIEDQLDKAISFYQQEIDKREWYGFWNYGDVMHSYDAARHSWKYDIGGFAWDNTELCTDIWLWYMFLRTGRADIFKMAEAMTRHTSEVDVYHLGRFAGLGSRHNVLHWGDGSKEVRESQAIFKRYYYYLTTDERTGDIMRETAQYADSGLLNVDPLRKLHPPSKYPTHARFGPDWVSLVGNWMTEWERTGDIKWKNKILVGLNDFVKMPYGFFSGKSTGGLGYDPRTNHIYQLDTADIGALALANLMGGMEMAHELLPLLDNKDFNRLYLQYCSLYGAPLEEVQSAFGKNVKTRLGNLAGDFARQPAYAYSITKDSKYAKRAWDAFLPNPQSPTFRGSRFDGQMIKGPMVVKPFYEIRNVSTNSTAQWCLNAIELLQLAGDAIPERHELWDK